MRFVSVLLCLVTLTVSAHAQSTCFRADLLNLRACIDSGVAACSSAAPKCRVLAAVLSIDDVVEAATGRCCNSARYRSRTARKVCLTLEEAKYRNVASTFRRALSTELRALRSSDCGRGFPTPTPTVTATPTIAATETPTTPAPTATVTPTATATATLP